MYESRHHPPVSRRHFTRRLLMHGAGSTALILGSLVVGMAGYAAFEGLGWRDAFLNAAMLLGGMGPVETPQTPAGKVFAGVYALWAGLIVVIAAGILFAPVFHRIIHKFHWVEDRDL